MSCLCKLKSGPRKGERCNAKVISGSRFCGRHANSASSGGGIPPSPKEYLIKLRFYVVRQPVGHDDSAERKSVKDVKDVSKLPPKIKAIFLRYLMKFDNNHSNKITVQIITFRKIPYITLWGTTKQPIDKEFWDGTIADMIDAISDKSLYQDSPRPKSNGFEYFLYHVRVD